MDAAQVVDLVDEPEALARRRRVVRIVVGAAHVDALGRADAGAQLAADALLHAVLVAVEDVTAVQPVRLRRLDVVGRRPARPARRRPRRGAALQRLPRGAPAGVVLRQPLAAEQAVLAERDDEALEVAHQPSALLRFRALTRSRRHQQQRRHRPSRRASRSRRATGFQSLSSPTRIAARNRNQPRATGISTFHPRSISWS